MITNIQDYKAATKEAEDRRWQAYRTKELQADFSECLKAASTLQHSDSYMIMHTLEFVIRLAHEAANALQRGK